MNIGMIGHAAVCSATTVRTVTMVLLAVNLASVVRSDVGDPDLHHHTVQTATDHWLPPGPAIVPRREPTNRGLHLRNLQEVLGPPGCLLDQLMPFLQEEDQMGLMQYMCGDQLDPSTCDDAEMADINEIQTQMCGELAQMGGGDGPASPVPAPPASPVPAPPHCPTPPASGPPALEPEDTVISPTGVDPSTWESHVQMKSTILPAGVPGESGEVSKAVALGDFNGDGNKDAFVVNEQGYPNEINFGDGQGGFTSVLWPNSVGLDGTGCTVGDFNNDAIDDVFVANKYGANEILVSDGQGSFTTTLMPRNDDSRGATTGDFNNDGIDDVYVANGDPSWGSEGDELLIGDGQGGFTSILQPPIRGPVPGTIHLPMDSPLCAGVLGQGTMTAELTLAIDTPIDECTSSADWAEGGCQGGSLCWSITVTVDGVDVSGTVDSYEASSKLVTVSWDADTTPMTAAGTPYSIQYTSPAPDSMNAIAGDFNGDGVDDVLLESSCAGDVAVCGRIMINDGHGGFTRAFRVGDCSLDQQHCLQGHQWLEDTNGAWIYEGDDTCSSYNDNTACVEIPTDTTQAAVGDFNADGFDDMFFQNAEKSVSLGDVSVTGREVLLSDGAGGYNSIGLTDGLDFGGAWGGATAGDFNGDGYCDIFTANMDDEGGASNRIWFSDGLGTFTTYLLPRADSSEDAAAGDFNDDGLDDVFVANSRWDDNDVQPNEVLVSEIGVFTSADLPRGDPSRGGCVGDFNEDGLDDAWVTNQYGHPEVLLSDDRGGFTSTLLPQLQSNIAVNCVVGNFNGDAHVDVFVVNMNEINIFWTGDGHGGFTADLEQGDWIESEWRHEYSSTLLPVESVTRNHQHRSMDATVGDFNGDGIDDIFVANEGAGCCVGEVEECGAPVEHLYGGEVRDGWTQCALNELLLSNGPTERYTSTLRGSGQDFGTVPSLENIEFMHGCREGDNCDVTRMGEEWSFAATTGDFNADGALDIFVAHDWDCFFCAEVLFGNGQGDFTSTFLAGANHGSKGATSADFNNDDVDDVFVSNAGTSNQLYISDGEGSFTITDLPSDDISYSATAGDFNADGNYDVYVGNMNFGNEMLLGNGRGYFNSEIMAGSQNTDGAVTGDFNGDGVDDIVAMNFDQPNEKIWWDPCARDGYFFTADEGAVGCYACPAYTTDTRHSMTKCELCNAGHIGISQGIAHDQQFFCIPCEAGSARGLTETECTVCPVGKYAGAGAASCEACGDGLITNHPLEGSSSCITCSAGKGPDPCGAACIDCQGKNYSQFGTCQPCPMGTFPSEGRIACESAGDMSVTSVETVATVLSSDPDILPQASLEFHASILDRTTPFENGQIPEVGSAEEAAVFVRMARAIAGSLQVQFPSGSELSQLREIEVVGLSNVGRRLQDAVGAVTFDFVVKSSNAAQVLESLIMQLADPSSSLRTNPALSEVNHEVPPTFEFVCRAGKEQPEGASSCVACSAGKFSPTGSPSCTRCTDPLMVPDATATSCVCPSGSFSRNQWVNCYEDDFFEMSSPTGSCTECPPCASCSGTSDPSPKPGYSLSESGPILMSDRMQFNFFKCPYDGCLGGHDAACQTSNETGLGHEGALCAACHDDYLLQDGRCKACDTMSSTTPLLIILVIVLVCTIARAAWGWLACAEATRDGVGAAMGVAGGVAKLLGQGARSSLKISIGLSQILSELPTVLDLRYPPLFTDTLELLRVLMLDVFKVCNFDCISKSSIHLKFVITMITPVVAIVIFNLLRIMSGAKLRTNTELGTVQVAERKRELSATCSSRTFGFLFLLYPMLSRTAFRMFVCRELDQGERWHVDEYTVDCNGGTHMAFQFLAAIAIVVYPIGVPLTFAYLLHKHRAVLSREPYHGVDEQKYREEEVTRNQAIRDQFSFLVADYTHDYYYWEVVVLLQKLLMTGLLTFVARGSIDQVFVGIITCFVFSSMSTKHAVFADSKDNLLKLVAEAQLFVTLVISLVLRSDLTGNQIGVHGYDTILVLVTIFMTPLVLFVFCLLGIWDVCKGNSSIIPVLPVDETPSPSALPDSK